MNFKVEDRFDHREKTIQAILEGGLVGLAVISAAADLEWTLRRAIIALGISPNKDLRAKLEKTSGLRKYANLWSKEVVPRQGRTLESLIAQWDSFVDVTYQLRHKLVHGAISNTSRDFAKPRVDEILLTTKRVVDFSETCGVDLYKRLPIRRNAWQPS
jgi:hypothetical protein